MKIFLVLNFKTLKNLIILAKQLEFLYSVFYNNKNMFFNCKIHSHIYLFFILLI
jgi:hypothetical protein